ncbi:PTS mannose/fructose/sorbose transporter family subunit IID [candidate division KSB1 bacterium]|nr:PTS mannose/fructose/sorbose transporter family subunit IID [candidate division KSB1 bacterium]
MARRRIQRCDLLSILVRSFFVQSSWNFQGLLGLGFCYCALPIACRLAKNDHEREKFFQRHIQFFNSHPYFSSWCLGAVARLEEDSLQKQWSDQRPIELFKDRLVGPLGLIGDELFWNGLKPASAALGVAVALFFGVVAIPVYLVFYNIPHLYVRIKGLLMGYEKGFDIVSDISVRRFQKWFLLARRMGLFLTGFFLAAALFRSTQSSFANTAAFIGSIPIALILLRRQKSILIAALLATGVAFLIGLANLAVGN